MLLYVFGLFYQQYMVKFSKIGFFVGLICAGLIFAGLILAILEKFAKIRPSKIVENETIAISIL